MAAATLKRVYHPSLNAWQDVPASNTESWKEAGWRMTKPDHVDDSDALPPAADTTPAPTTTAAAK